MIEPMYTDPGIAMAIRMYLTTIRIWEAAFHIGLGVAAFLQSQKRRSAKEYHRDD